MTCGQFATICLEAEWPFPVGLGRQRMERLAQLLRLHAAHDADGADVMAVQGVRETPQHRLIGIRRHAVDDQLAARDAERDLRTVFKELARRGGSPIQWPA